MSEPASKKFYLETFGCQMNAHDSEKVVGTLLSQGYRQAGGAFKPGFGLSGPFQKSHCSRLQGF